MLILNREISNKWLIIAGAIVGAVLIFVFLSIPSCQKPPVTPQQTFNEVLTIAQKPLLVQIEDQKKQVADYKSRYLVSEEKARVWNKKYDDLKREKDNVKPPVTNAETRTRFIAAGFTPLPVK